MSITWPIFAAVLFGALLHASWNALVKSSTDKTLDMALIHLIGSVMAIPLVAWVGWPVAAAWPFIAASVVIHIGYYIATTQAYTHGDLGLTYPIMRGVAPLLVALVAVVSLGETLSALAWGGIIVISSGVLVLGLNQQVLHAPKAVFFALVNAAIIAAYTVVDALGVRASGHALQYVATLFLLDGLPFGLVVMAMRGRSAGVYARHRWPVASLGALASLGSYGIALWAMTSAPVAVVAALRETSVLFAVLIGAWFLKESLSIRRVFGACTIVLGVMVVRVA